MNICYLADRHGLYDDRIYWKMAVPFVKMGHQVHYLLIGDENKEGVTSEGVHYRMFKIKTFSGNRFLNFALKRMNPWNNYRKLFKEAAGLKADIYHFHDFWLNRIGVKLKRLSHRPAVFYDAREPYAEDYLSYVKSPVPLAVKFFSLWVDHWEKEKSKHYDLVIANEPIVGSKFAKVLGKDKSIVLYNYSDQTKDFKRVPPEEKTYDLIYCGAVTELRGAFEMVRAVGHVRKKIPSVKALFLGNYYPASLKADLTDLINRRHLKEHIVLMDAVPYPEVPKYYNMSKIGLAVLKQVRTFEISMPIKLFEYMGFGLPIVGSNFGHIRDYIRQDQCGIVVNPNDPEEIAEAVVRLLNTAELFDTCSQNGLEATRKKYNWKMEFEKLHHHYSIHKYG